MAVRAPDVMSVKELGGSFPSACFVKAERVLRLKRNPWIIRRGSLERSRKQKGLGGLDLVIERSGAAGLHMVVEVNMTAESRSLSKCHRANKVRSDTYMESL
jgi:hypothetical protein